MIFHHRFKKRKPLQKNDEKIVLSPDELSSMTDKKNISDMYPSPSDPFHMAQDYQDFFAELPDADELNDLMSQTENLDRRISITIRFFFVKKMLSRIFFTQFRIPTFAAVLCVVSFLFLLSFPSTQSFLHATFSEQKVSYETVRQEDALHDYQSFLEPQYLPEGFEETSRTSSIFSLSIRYTGANNATIHFIQTSSGQSSFFLDFENHLKHPVTLSVGTGYYYSSGKGFYHQLSWTHLNYQYIINTTMDVSLDSMIKIANSFK